MSSVTSQTVGPYFSIGLAPLYKADMAGSEAQGERFTLEGRVLDGARNPVPDAIIEVWQANAFGKYAHSEDHQDKTLDANFRGYGRVATNNEGVFRFSSIKPGKVAGPNGIEQAPHLQITVFMRGLMKHLLTRVYFPDDPANVNDPILKLAPEARRSTLVARQAGDTLRWDILLQGADETVFFDV